MKRGSKVGQEIELPYNLAIPLKRFESRDSDR